MSLPTDLFDYTTDYASKVVSGELAAGPHVMASCARHLDDLKKGHLRGLRFDVQLATRAISFFPKVLKLNGGAFEGAPFELLHWQKFIVGSLFGWVKIDDGSRRFRVAYVESGKGSGKSPLAAGVGLYMMLADGEARAEIYAAATKKDQAAILFRDAVAMRDLSNSLSKRLVKSGRGDKAHNLADHRTGSFFKPISSDGDSQSGPRPHCALLDEIHEHKDASIVEMMRAGTKGRRHALIFMITNAGTDKRGVCWDYHDYGDKVARRVIDDDAFFSYICALDEKDDPFKDPSCWGKANPSLGITIKSSYLEEQVRHARGMPSKESIVRRLNFCQWTGSAAPWLSREIWEDAGEEYDFDSSEPRRVLAGLDLSSTTDLTAFVLLFCPCDSDPVYRLLPFFWLPEQGLEEKEKKDRVPYQAWVRDGYIETTPGKAISKLHVAQRLVEICDKYGVESIAFDRWRIEDLKSKLAEEGADLPLVSHGQGFKDMTPAIEKFEELLLNDELLHSNSPVLTWNASSATLTLDPSGNKKTDKQKATGRIDGIVAAVMACGLLSKDTGGDDLDDFLASPVIVKS